MQRLQALLPRAQVTSSAARGLPPLQVEATAFAWLARKTVNREKLALQSITGAKGARVLGVSVSGLAGEIRPQAEKLEPQPQVVVAFGFLITNWAPCRSSL